MYVIHRVIKSKQWALAFIMAIVGISQAQNRPQWAEGIIAVVGDKIVLRSELETRLAEMATDTIADMNEAKCLVLRQLVTEKILLNQAELDSLEITDEQIEGELDNRLRYFQRQIGSQNALENYLGMTVPEYKKQIRPKLREQLLVQQMRSKIVSDVLVSPKDVQLFFDTIPKAELPIVPSSLQVGQFIYQPKPSEFAKEFILEQMQRLRSRLINGESFETLAKLYSQDPGSKVQGGLLPEFGRGEMVPAFEREAFKLKPDSLSPIFESEFGYHIMKLVSRKGDRIIAKHILLRPELINSDKQKAQFFMDSLYKELKNGADWCGVVKAHNNSTYSNAAFCGFMQDESTGGDKVFYENLSPELKQLIDQMQPGTYSKPQASNLPTGDILFFIVYFKELYAPHTADLKYDYDRIKLQAEEAKKQAALMNWLKKTSKNTYLKINLDKISCETVLNF